MINKPFIEGRRLKPRLEVYEVGLRRLKPNEVALNLQSAQADLASLQPRIHSPGAFFITLLVQTPTDGSED